MRGSGKEVFLTVEIDLKGTQQNFLAEPEEKKCHSLPFGSSGKRRGLKGQWKDQGGGIFESSLSPRMEVA